MLVPHTFLRDRYLIERRVGGDTGAIYQASDTNSKAQVVLKHLIDDLDEHTALFAEFMHAAELLAGMQHTNLPRIIDYFVEEERALLVMAFVPGNDLAAMLERRDEPFAVDRVLGWADQLLDALDYLHTQQPPVVHGDIKPKNIKPTPDGTVMLLDAALPKGSPLTAQRQVAIGARGSASPFLPPEHFAGVDVDERSDLFALAATLYYLLTRVLPISADRRAIIVARGQPDSLLAPHAINRQIPAALSMALMSTLALDPSQRPASAAKLRAMLKGATDDPAVVALVPPLPKVLDTTPVVAGPLTPEPPVAAADPADPAVPMASQPPRRLTMLGIAGAIVLLLLLVLWLRGVDTAPSAAPSTALQPTAQPQPTNQAPAVAATSLPTAAPAVIAASATVSPSTPPVAQVFAFEEPSIFAGAASFEFDVYGTDLDQIRSARLIADGRAPIEATIQSNTEEQITLVFAALPETLDGEVIYTLQLDDTSLLSPTITLRDFIERKTMKGILTEHSHTNRVATNRSDIYTRMRTDPNVDSEPVGQLRNGDIVEVLSADRDGWYQLRIYQSGDTAEVGVEGWIERWLVDNQGAPQPAPVPTQSPRLIFAGRTGNTPTDAAVQCGTVFASSIYGSVEDRSGRGIAGARLRVSSADGRNNYPITTGRGGVYSVPGLGCTTWIVRLISVPGAPGGISANTVTVRNLNGGALTAAEVRFRLQP